MATTAETLALALEHHRAGQLAQAEQLYHAILQIDPRHADALHLLGMLAHQRGHYQQALACIRQALALNPNEGSYHSNLGLVYQSLRQFDEAGSCYRKALRLRPDVPETHNNLGATRAEQGRLEEAIACYHQALRLRPNYPKAHHNLGIALARQGQLVEAIACYRQAVRLAPDYAEAHYNLGNVLRDQGQLDEAAACYRRALSLRSDYPDAHNNLGIVLREQGHLDEALASYHQALLLRPDSPEVHNNLGVTLRDQKRLDEAGACFRQALTLRPDYSEAHDNLGKIFLEQKRLEEASACYRQVVRLRPDYAEGRHNLAHVLREQGKLDEAAIHYRQVVALRPENPEAHNNLGNVLGDLGQRDEAIASYQQALRLRPEYPEALNNLGNALEDQGRRDDAVACYRQALALRSNFPEARYNLGIALREQGKFEEAETCFRQALRLKPDMAEAHYNLGLLLASQGQPREAEEHLRESLRLQPSPTVRLVDALLLPIIYQSREEVVTWRQRFADNIRQLHEENFTLDLTTQAAPTPFLLVYQGEDDRDLVRKLTSLHVPPADSPRPPQRKGQAGKIKVGFISHFFRNHTVGRLMRGLMAQLARDSFAVTVLSVGRHEDAMARFIQQQADVFLEVPAQLPAARQLLTDQGLDVLIYTDIGMDSVTYSLAFSRLAPVQCVAWGHGVTTGIPTLDYFLSGELLETEEGDRHYTERLVRLPNLGVYYYRPELPTSPRGRAYFGLPEEGRLYACLQTLFKLHPDFDALLGGILRRDRHGLLLLLQGKFPHFEKMLRQRFAVTLPDVQDRIRFLPLQPNEDYLNLMALADVLVDPLYNVGGNSSFEGFALGMPIVTLPTRHLGGRLTRALYAQMGIWDCVAESAEDYVNKAVRLGTDPDYRAEVRARIRAANDVLYENPAGVRGLEQFLQKAVALGT